MKQTHLVLLRQFLPSGSYREEIAQFDFAIFLVLDSVPCPYSLSAKYWFSTRRWDHTCWRMIRDGLPVREGTRSGWEGVLRGITRIETKSLSPNKISALMLSLSWRRKIFLPAHSQPCIVATDCGGGSRRECVLFLGWKKKDVPTGLEREMWRRVAVSFFWFVSIFASLGDGGDVLSKFIFTTQDAVACYYQ